MATQAELDAEASARIAATTNIPASALAAALDLSSKTLTLPAANTPALTKYYDSGQQTITSAGALTLAHGLGVKPKLIQMTIVCQSAEAGYSVGDEIVITINQTGTAADRHTSVKLDATNITVRFSSTGAVFYTANASTGAAVGLTNASWKLVVRAWA